MHRRSDSYGRFSTTALAAANITYAIINSYEDGTDRKRALAICSELSALASGLRAERSGSIMIARQAKRFEDSFCNLSASITIDAEGAQLLYEHTWRNVSDGISRFQDTKYSGEAYIPKNLEIDQARVSEWVNFASLFLHRSDGVTIVTSNDQRWL